MFHFLIRLKKHALTAAVILLFSFSLEKVTFAHQKLKLQTPVSEISKSIPRIGVWSEFITYTELERIWLPVARKFQFDLYVAIRPNDLKNPKKLMSLFSAAAIAGVELRPWILLEVKDGYWANKWNAAKVRAAVFTFLDLLKKENLSAKWVTLDIEPPAALMKKVMEDFANLRFISAWRVLKMSSQIGELSAARTEYQKLVKDLHDQKIKVHAVTLPLVLHDRKSSAIQSALGVPTEGIDWDEISFMIYRPEFAKIMGPVGSDLVSLYAQRARAKFGDRAGVDLGEIGDVQFPEPTKGFSDPEELRNDLSASRAAGIQRLHVYSLDGMRSSAAASTSKFPKPEAWMVEFAFHSDPQQSVLPISMKTRLFLWALDLFAKLLPKAK